MKPPRVPWEKVLVILIIIYGFFLRFYGLRNNFSLWVDEASTARFAYGIVKTGIPQTLSTGFIEKAYFLPKYLTALSFKFFGLTETAARLPEVFFGSLLILIVYLVGKNLFNKQIALGAAALTAFSYIEIAWSRQARGYVILQNFFLLTIFFTYRYIESQRKKDALFLTLFLILSVATHTLGLVLIPIIGCFFLIQNFSRVKKQLLNPKALGGAVFVLLLVALYFFSMKNIFAFHFAYIIPRLLHGKNFISYYHSLLWRQYPLFTFLSILGLGDLFFLKRRELFFLLGGALGIYLFFICFLLGVPFEKYSLAIFPIVFLLSSYVLFRISELFFKNKANTNIIFALMISLILINGNKFTLKPKNFYTLNYDMQEIPEIDDKKFYEFIKNKTAALDYSKVAIIDIDEDIPAWYLGENSVRFNPRKDVPKETIDTLAGGTLIHNLDEFVKIKEKFPHGFVLLIGHNFRFYPDGMVDYVRKNLKLEIKEDTASFAPDWIKWPVELYSWGFNNVK